MGLTKFPRRADSPRRQGAARTLPPLRSPFGAGSLSAPGDADTTGAAGVKVSFEYEIVVIGSGRAGERAAKRGARFGSVWLWLSGRGRAAASGPTR